MYSEEETELRDLIIQNLENCGFLNKIKAQFRAGVFLALEEDGNLRNKIPLFNQKFDDFVNTSEGKLVLSLVREFLEYFDLNFTLSVFDPEVSVATPCISRAELCNQLKLNSDLEGPIISSLLKQVESYNTFSKSNGKFDVISDQQVKSVLNETLILQKNTLDNVLNKEHLSDFNLGKDRVKDNMENNEEIVSSVLSSLSPNIEDSNPSEKIVSDIRTKSEEIDASKNNEIFKNPKGIQPLDHDPFFDEPLPTEKPSFFSFSDTLKEKSQGKGTSSIKNDLNDSNKTSLSSLRDLPSLTANSEWAFSRDLKNILPSLESVKSVSSSETSNEEIINLDAKENFQKKDSDIVESNEESSEKQNSESIDEDIEEDFSACFDDMLNSSLSLGDDVTTDQTVSQVSVVEGIDHVEPCNS